MNIDNEYKWLEQYLLTGSFPKGALDDSDSDVETIMESDNQTYAETSELPNESDYESGSIALKNNKKRTRRIYATIGLLLVLAVWAAIFYIEIKYKDEKIPYDTSFELQTHLYEKEYPEYESDGKTLTMTGLSDVMLSRIVKIEIYSDDNGKIRVGSGSGIIINNDGYILTNAHVIEYDYDNEDGSYDIAKYIYVKFHGDDEDAQGIKATYIGKDHTNDIGILKIDGKEDLKFAEFGDSDNLKVGEKIAVVGNPQNLGISVSDGIVSALDRRLYTRKTPLIQVTAAINPGNSGGALVDMYGTVVGIISSKYSNSESLGFAIPINYAKPIIEDIIRYGYPSGRYRLGITSGEIYQQEMRDKYLEESSIEIPEEVMYGVAVFNIDEDFKISESGIKKFDIITAINGKEVKALEDITDFTKTIDDKTPFDISVLRHVDGEWIKVVIQNVYLTQDKSGNY